MLVGVAIAASLLPPVVNCGMCLAYGLTGANKHNDQYPQLTAELNDYLTIAGKIMSDTHTHTDTGLHIFEACISPLCLQPTSVWYVFACDCVCACVCVCVGYSFLLFLINIACIYSVCLLVFIIKRIRPIRRQLLHYTDLPPIETATGAAAARGGDNAPIEYAKSAPAGAMHARLSANDTPSVAATAPAALPAGGPRPPPPTRTLISVRRSTKTTKTETTPMTKMAMLGLRPPQHQA